MSVHQMLRRVAVPPQMASKQETTTIPAPVRGLDAERERSLHAAGRRAGDGQLEADPARRGAARRLRALGRLPETTPVISAFNYVSGINHACSRPTPPSSMTSRRRRRCWSRAGRRRGNYAAAQLANAAGDCLIVVNDAGDLPLRFDGTTWTTLTPARSPARWAQPSLAGENLVYVCKYRNRLFFIERNSMNAWYLGINAIGGVLEMIPLSGAASKGGKLLFCAVWSLDAGDGIDDKLVFCTDLGETADLHRQQSGRCRQLAAGRPL